LTKQSTLLLHVNDGGSFSKKIEFRVLGVLNTAPGLKISKFPGASRSEDVIISFPTMLSLLKKQQNNFKLPVE